MAANVNFFTPCLLFSKMAYNATLSTYLEIWPILPIYVGLVTLSNLLAYFGTRALGISAHRKFTTLAIFLTNTNSFPISIFMSVAHNPSVNMLLRWGKDDTSKGSEGRGLTYIMMFLALTNLVCWSYGIKLLTPEPSPTIIDETSPMLPNEQRTKSPLSQSVKLMRGFRSCLNPPLTAILAAFLVALVPPLKSLLLSDSFFSIALMSSLNSCGSAAVPCLILSLGGSLAFLLRRGRFLSFRLVGFIAFSRLIVVPLVMAPTLFLLRPYFSLGGDPTFLFVMMLILSTPTAVNSLSLCQSVRVYEDEMAMVLLLSYLTALPVLTVSVSCYMYILQLIE